jgi:MFS family permease
MRRFVWSIYGFSFLQQCILIYPVYALLFQSHGLGPVEIGTLFALWTTTAITLEIPSGVLADRFSRRNILSIASILKAMCFAAWLLSDSFAGFAAGFVLWGASSALISGTFQAFVYDELKEAHQEHLFEQISGHARGWEFAGMTLGVLLGGFAAEIGFAYALIPSVMAPFLAALLMLSIRPAPRVQATEEARYLHILRDAFREACHNPLLLKLILFITLVFGATAAADEFWSLWLSEIHFSFAMIGVIFAVANILSSVAGFTAHRLPLPGRRLPAFTLLGGLAALLMSMVNPWVAVLLLLPMIYIVEASRVKYEARLQHAIASHRRATVSSINSLLLGITALGFYLAVGALADHFGFVSFLWLMGGIVVVATLVAMTWPARISQRMSIVPAPDTVSP